MKKSKSDIITVSIIEDDPVIRLQLSILINNSPDIGCISLYPDAEDAIQGLSDLRPNVILLDLGLPGISGIECLKILRDRLPETDFLILTVSELDQDVFDSICAGATGYLLKETPSEHILHAIREVRQGGSPMSAGIARKVVQSFYEPRDDKKILSDRETEVLKMLCNGENYKAIADKLYVSGHTIRAHIKNIYKKLHVHSRAEAVKTAIQTRLI